MCDLLGEADIETVDAAATSEVDGSEELAAGMDFDRALPASGSEELFDQPQGLEDLQGARVNDGGSIPVERHRLGIDHVAGHASAARVGGEEQAGRAGSDDEHYGLMAWAVHRRKGFQKIWAWVGVVNPVTFSRRKCSVILVGDLAGEFRQGNFEGKAMASMETQISKSARLTIERGESETLGTVFRLAGPFTGQDMCFLSFESGKAS